MRRCSRRGSSNWNIGTSKLLPQKSILPVLTLIELREPTDMAASQEENGSHTKDETAAADIPAGHIIDYISGNLVKATPEEVEPFKFLPNGLSRTLVTQRTSSPQGLNSGFARGPLPNASEGIRSTSPFSMIRQSLRTMYSSLSSANARPARTVKSNYNSTSQCHLPKLVSGSTETTISIFTRNISRTAP